MANTATTETMEQGLPESVAGPEDEKAYTRWLRAKVAASLADPRPNISQKEVFRQTRAMLDARANKGKS